MQKRLDFVIFRGGGGVPVNPREFNIATLFFVEVNISPHPSIVPSLSEIRDLSVITPCLGSLMDTLLLIRWTDQIILETKGVFT